MREITNPTDMTRFRFKFNKKSIRFELDETQPYRHYEGWLATAIHAHNIIISSDVYTDDDKKRIKQLKMYSIYKMLQRI